MRTNIFDIFSRTIFPGFPFREPEWIAIAFERDNYDNTRMPEWFFREAADEFSADGRMLIKGYGENFCGHPSNTLELAFSWDEYKKFMLSKKGYSPEYLMVGAAGSWACRADGELAVFGGEPTRMNRIFARHGGKDEVFAAMQRDFSLHDEQRNSELRTYLRELVFRPGVGA